MSLISLVGVACGSADGSADGTPVEGAPMGGEAFEMFVFEGLTDWVSYATAVAAVEVVSEEILPPEEPEEFERLVGRTVTVEFEDVLWGEGPPDGRATIIAPGWFENTREGTRRPFVAPEGARYEVGGRYVVAFILWQGEWGEMTSSSVIPITGDVLTPSPGAPPAAAELTGLTLDDLRARLNATEPDPLAAKYMHLDPHERYRVVWDERHGPVDMTPGPNEVP